MERNYMSPDLSPQFGNSEKLKKTFICLFKCFIYSQHTPLNFCFERFLLCNVPKSKLNQLL